MSPRSSCRSITVEKSNLISIITPLLNEEEYVKPFLDHISSLDGSFELILVDGGSTDATLRELRRNTSRFDPKIRLVSSERGRAIQMNRGAKEARGDILFFLHADCMTPKDAIILIEKEISSGRTIGGGFRQAFSDQDPFLRTISIFGNLRAGLSKTFFGDYGIFLKRDIFQKIGGYGRVAFLEDVELCRKAKRCGKLDRIDSCIYTSSRRFGTEGKIKLTFVFALACLLSLVRLRPAFLKRYFDKM